MAAPLGEFEVLVLMAVARLGEAAHAPGVRAEIVSRTGRHVARGAVYVTIDRLSVKGLLGSRPSAVPIDPASRVRRTYRVTAKGLRAVRQTLTGLAQMQDGLEGLLDLP